MRWIVALAVTVVGSALTSGCADRSAPYVSMGSLPIAGRWRVVAESKMTAQEGGCESPGICLAVGVIAPNGQESVADAQAALVAAMRKRGWSCITPSRGGSMAMVNADHRTWTEMIRLDTLNGAATAGNANLAVVANAAPPGTTGLAVSVTASRARIRDPTVAFVDGGCPSVP